MARVSPLNTVLEQQDASFKHYGPPDAGTAVVDTFGELESEYAAIRKGCALFDWPQRSMIAAHGADRIEYLNRMVTQELKGLGPGRACRSFWLNRKGRIDADLRLIELGDQTLIATDLLAASRTVETLSEFVFTEDVTLADRTDDLHMLALHGPTAWRLLSRAALIDPALAPQSPDTALTFAIGGRNIIADRQDALGVPGFDLIIPAEDLVAVYESLLRAAESHDKNAPPPDRIRLKPAGWHAWNIARIEAGWPVFNIDFGERSLPHETGVLKDRVSFTKGCYLGQEVVARMQSLGHPKQILVGVRLELPEEGRAEDLPIAGAPVYAANDADAKPIGAVTSSTRSPMLGDAGICFAQVKWGRHEHGAALRIDAAGGSMSGRVNPELRFWNQPDAG